MDDRITNDYIMTAINELIGAVGIKEPVSADVLKALLCSGGVQECVKAVGDQLGLSIRVKVINLSSQAADSVRESFHSTKLSRTDAQGHGIEGITAQIRMPSHVPLYGSAAFQQMQVDVLIGGDVARHPRTFLAVMAHELSHVVLHSLGHPERENEVWTDLAAMVQGFADILGAGRKQSEERWVSGVRKQVETTFGYLTDTQFDFAYARVQAILADMRRTRQNALALASTIVGRCAHGLRMVQEFQMLLTRLHEQPHKKYRRKDGAVLVRCHEPGYPESLARSLQAAEECASRAYAQCQSVSWHTRISNRLVCEHSASLQAIAADLGPQLDRIAREIRTLTRCAGLVFRLKRWLRSG